MPDSFPDPREPRVVHVDDRVVALLKPPRMHTAPLPSGSPGESTLCGWAFERFPELRDAASPGTRPGGEGGLLHRLDYETSGLVLFARDPAAHAFLLAEQERGELRKEYLLWAAAAASVGEEPRGSRPARSFPLGTDAEDWEGALRAGQYGEPTTSAGHDALVRLIRRSLEARDSAERPGIASRFRPFGPGAAKVACLAPSTPEGGSPARRRPGTASIYRSEILGAASVEAGLELRVALVRGFRHQIRAHLAWVGLPLLGDGLYGGKPWPRLCLHACRISFGHPSGFEMLLEG